MEVATIIYRAKDGRTFTDPLKCEEYEKMLGIIPGSIGELVTILEDKNPDYLVCLMVMWWDNEKKKIQAVMNSGTKTVYVDIMKDGAFYQQIPYSYCPLWPIDKLKVQKYVLDRMPSLRGHKFSIALTNNRVR